MKCSACNIDKPHTKEFFYPTKACSGGLAHQCKICRGQQILAGRKKPGAKYPAWKKQYNIRNKERLAKKAKEGQLRRMYGLTLEAAEKIYAKGCESCGDKNARLHIDHCHTTKQVRGCLCINCNRALGWLKEDPARAEKLKGYMLLRCVPLKLVRKNEA